eukprot:814925_1
MTKRSKKRDKKSAKEPVLTAHGDTELIEGMVNKLDDAKCEIKGNIETTLNVGEQMEYVEGGFDGVKEAAESFKRIARKVKQREKDKTAEVEEVGKHWMIVGVVALIVIAMLVFNAYLDDTDYDDDDYCKI